MDFEMVEMSKDGFITCFNDVFHDFSFVIRLCVPFFDGDGILWTVSNAGT